MNCWVEKRLGGVELGEQSHPSEDSVLIFQGLDDDHHLS